MKIAKEIDHVRNVTSSIAYHYLELGHECSSFSIDSFASSLFVRLYETVCIAERGRKFYRDRTPNVTTFDNLHS